MCLTIFFFTLCTVANVCLSMYHDSEVGSQRLRIERTVAGIIQRHGNLGTSERVLCEALNNLGMGHLDALSPHYDAIHPPNSSPAAAATPTLSTGSLQNGRSEAQELIDLLIHATSIYGQTIQEQQTTITNKNRWLTALGIITTLLGTCATIATFAATLKKPCPAKSGPA